MIKNKYSSKFFVDFRLQVPITLRHSFNTVFICLKNILNSAEKSFNGKKHTYRKIIFRIIQKNSRMKSILMEPTKQRTLKTHFKDIHNVSINVFLKQ